MRLQLDSRRIGVLVSGRGSNFRAIADNVKSRALDAEIVVVVSNRENAPGLEEARHRGIEAIWISSENTDRERFDERVIAELTKRRVALVCLAGFMRILTPAFVRAFPNAILNIHPSLLPAFPGLDAQKQALEHGVQFSGCTVHLVDNTLDGGPIVRQAVVPVTAADTVQTLSDRILVQEHRIYSEAIDAVLSGRCDVSGRRVVVHEEST